MWKAVSMVIIESITPGGILPRIISRLFRVLWVSANYLTSLCLHSLICSAGKFRRVDYPTFGLTYSWNICFSTQQLFVEMLCLPQQIENLPRAKTTYHSSSGGICVWLSLVPGRSRYSANLEGMSRCNSFIHLLAYNYNTSHSNLDSNQEHMYVWIHFKQDPKNENRGRNENYCRMMG